MDKNISLHGVALAFFLLTAGPAHALDYPVKPVRFVIPFPAGGFSDILGRFLGQRLSETTGQPVINDNRAGASGNIGAEIVARAHPDGHTLLINSFNFVANPGVMSLSFDPIKDFAAVSLIADGPPLVVTVAASSSFRSVKELVAYARANPGRLNVASSGAGTTSSLAIDLLSSIGGLKVIEVPYKGASPALTAVLSNEVAVSFPNLPAILPLLGSGRLRALGVTSLQRTGSLPDVPTMIEAGLPGYELDGFLGVLAPAPTPQPIIKALHDRLIAITREPAFMDRLKEYGMRPIGSTPAEFKAFLQAQISKWNAYQKGKAQGTPRKS
ncbi:MAG: Bug family tripartite tricarboxylate transporter substrate binding protein [Burkholderiales bacterium]